MDLLRRIAAARTSDERAEAMCACELIPVEIWALIGTFSDAADFLALACTSSVMNRVLDDDYAWLGITTLSSEPLDLDVVNKERCADLRRQSLQTTRRSYNSDALRFVSDKASGTRAKHVIGKPTKRVGLVAGTAGGITGVVIGVPLGVVGGLLLGLAIGIVSLGGLAICIPYLVLGGYYAGLYGGFYGGALIAAAPCAAITAGAGCIAYVGVKATGKTASASDSALGAAKKAYKRAKFASSRAKMAARDSCIRAARGLTGVRPEVNDDPLPIAAQSGDLMDRAAAGAPVVLNDQPLPSPVQSGDLMESQLSTSIFGQYAIGSEATSEWTFRCPILFGFTSSLKRKDHFAVLVFLRNKQLLCSKLPGEWGSDEVPGVSHSSVAVGDEEVLAIHVSKQLHEMVEAVAVVVCNPSVPRQRRNKGAAHLDPVRGIFKAVPCVMEIGVAVEGFEGSDGTITITEEDVARLENADDDAEGGRVMHETGVFEAQEIAVGEYEAGRCNAYLAAVVRPRASGDDEQEWSCELARRPFQAHTLFDVVRVCTERLRTEQDMNQKVIMSVHVDEITAASAETDADEGRGGDRKGNGNVSCTLIGHDRLDRYCGRMEVRDLDVIPVNYAFELMPQALEMSVVLSVGEALEAVRFSYDIEDECSGERVGGESEQVASSSMVICQFSRRRGEGEFSRGRTDGRIKYMPYLVAFDGMDEVEFVHELLGSGAPSAICAEVIQLSGTIPRGHGRKVAMCLEVVDEGGSVLTQSKGRRKTFSDENGASWSDEILSVKLKSEDACVVRIKCISVHTLHANSTLGTHTVSLKSHRLPFHAKVPLQCEMEGVLEMEVRVFGVV